MYTTTPEFTWLLSPVFWGFKSPLPCLNLNHSRRKDTLHQQQQITITTNSHWAQRTHTHSHTHTLPPGSVGKHSRTTSIHNSSQYCLAWNLRASGLYRKSMLARLHVCCVPQVAKVSVAECNVVFPCAVLVLSCVPWISLFPDMWERDGRKVGWIDGRIIEG